MKLIFSSFFVAQHATALHEDEKGLYDWHLKGFGVPTAAALTAESSKAKTAFVVTSSNVLAAIKLNSGELRWRHVFGKKDTLSCVAALDDRVLTCLEHTCFVFDAAGGAMLRTAALKHSDVRIQSCSHSGQNFVVAASSTEEGKENVITLFTMHKEGMSVESFEKQTSEVSESTASMRATPTAIFGITARNKAWSVSLPLKHSDPQVLSLTQLEAGRIDFVCDDFAFVGSQQITKSADGLKIEKLSATNSYPVCGTPKTVVLGFQSGFASVNGIKTELTSRGIPYLIGTTFHGDKHAALIVTPEGHSSLLKVEGDDVSIAWINYGGMANVERVLLAGEAGVALEAPDGSPTTRRDMIQGIHRRFMIIGKNGVVYTMAASGRGKTLWTIDLFAAAKEELAGAEFSDISFIGARVDGDVALFGLQYQHDITARCTVKVQVSNGARLKTLKGWEALPESFTAIESTDKKTKIKQVLWNMDASNGVVFGGPVGAENWRINFDAPITAFAAGSDDRHRIATTEDIRGTPNKTRGDTEIRRKYPLGNIIATAHFTPEVSADDFDEVVPDAATTLVINAIDSVTGNIVGTVKHNDAEGPIHLLVAENMIIYNFFNTKKMHNYVGMWEFFEHSDQLMLDSQTTSPAQVVMSLFSKRRHFAPTTKRLPQIIPRVLFFPYGDICAMDVTTSHQGIARKMLVFATSSGNIMTTPLSFLALGGAPQAPAGQPQLPEDHVIIPSTAYLSHVERVQHPQMIATAPTPLESTSHVVVAGVDVFYTRSSSGKPFDVLNSDFNKQALLAIVTVLPALCLVLRIVSQKRTLALAWS